MNFQPLHIISNLDYYPFGMEMASRSGSVGNYRYGFNGYENDDEVAGESNHLDFGNFGYNSRLGRRLNVDPVVKHHESPYVAFANNPIWFAEENGMDTLIIHRSSARNIKGINHYIITFEVIEKGVSRMLPYEFQQASNDYYVQLPKNSDIPLEFRRMGSDDNDPNYKNTIFVKGKKKPNGEYYAIFMHPTAYGVGWLRGCLATYCVLKDDGTPDIDVPEGEDSYKWKEKETGEVLNLIFQMYNQDNNIGNREGNYEGNDFFMRTDSYPLVKMDKIDASPIDIPIGNRTPELPSECKDGQ